MPPRHALVIAVDGLRASALGAYGNTWHPTPALDDLACQSVVYDWMWCTSPTAADFYRGAWQAAPTLCEMLASAGVATALTTDDIALANADMQGFDEICRLDAYSDSSAATVGDTAMARLFAVAAQQLPAAAKAALPGNGDVASRLWWLHASGFQGPWDAPLELRHGLLEEDDPSPPTYVAPPHSLEVTDHDELLRHRVAYAAQVMVLDECVGGLLAELAESGLAEHTLVILVGCRGYALGEHGIVGGDRLYSELLHVPCLLRIPSIVAPPQRLSSFVQPADLFATLAKWFGVSAASGQGCSLFDDADMPQAAPREFVAARSAHGELAIRTAAWMLRQEPLHEADRAAPAVVELYAKPDDRWEVNEVASRCRDVAARLQTVITRGRDQANSASREPPLDRDLVSPAR